MNLERKASLWGRSAPCLLAVWILVASSSPAAAGTGEGRPPDVARDAALQLRQGDEAYQRGDFAEAFRRYRNLAVLGDAEVHFRLGLMCRDGLGVRKSVRQAEYWLGLAVSARHPGAAQALASLHAARGEG